MTLSQGIPVLLTFILGPLLSMLAWGYWRSRHAEAAKGPVSNRDNLLLAFLLLAALSFGAFLVFVLLTVGE